MRFRAKSNVTMFFLSIIVSSQFIFTQDTQNEDRLSRIRDIINNNELILLWSQGEDENEHFSYQRIYNLDLTQPNVDQTLVPAGIHNDQPVAGNRRMAVATGNFLDDGYKHVVAAWTGPENTISVLVPEINAGTLDWTDVHRLSIPGPLASTGAGKIHLVTGDFFGSSRTDEFVLAYHGADGTVNLQVFSFNSGSLIPQPRGSINDEMLYDHDGTRHDQWDIVTGDFNGNGYDEIALLFVKPIGVSNWALALKIYSVDDQGNVIPRALQEIHPNPDHYIAQINISGAAGDFTNSPHEEIAFGFTFTEQNISDPDTYVYFLEVQDNLNNIVAEESRRIVLNAQNESEVTPINIAAGDLNGNFRDELVLVTAGSTRIYSLDNQLIPQFRLSRGAPEQSEGYEDYFLAVDDMDGSGNAEIVLATNFRQIEPGGMQYFIINVMSIDSTLTSSTVKARRENEMPVSSESGFRNFAIALGDLDGDRTWLGPPVHYRRTGVLQPSVILNTPPIHYDIVNSTVYDLSGCFPMQGCGFLSTYTQTSTTAKTVTIEIHEDWGISDSAELSVGVGKAKITAKYGEKFSNKTTSTETMTISTGRIAAGDDWIYANTYDIDFYEYPVFDGRETTPVGYYLVSIPKNIRPLWIEAKDDRRLGNLYRPNHEPGNILSYRPVNTSDLSSHIVDFPEQTIGSTGSSFVSLVLSTFNENSAETSRESGVEVGVTLGTEVDIYGIEVGFTAEFGGHYNTGEIITQTVSVNESLEMRGDLGSLQSQFGTAATYHVQPYAYWTSYGALALDYKVSIPDGDNFWHDHYGDKPDLGFSLPWRYDVQKDIPLPGNDASYIYRTRDIVLSENEPRAGEKVIIGARIRNLGLQVVNSPFTVYFYLGDPLSGGLEIANALIDTIIAPRHTHTVFVEWDIPIDTDLKDARIYGVIDPENSIINEIHDNNNMGWAPVISLGTTTAIGAIDELPTDFVLHQAYPNPFNPSTTISFDLHTTAHVLLRVYDMLGQEVVTLADEMRTAGNHRVTFMADGLASGVYFYRIDIQSVNGSMGRFIDTRKMVYIK
jgi:hypothetical protein